MPRGFAPSKKDTSQPGIEQAFINDQWSVCDVHALGKDAPDLFVSKELSQGLSVTIAIECKTGNNKRKEHQIDWGERWQGHYLWGSDKDELLRQARLILASYELVATLLKLNNPVSGS